MPYGSAFLRARSFRPPGTINLGSAINSTEVLLVARFFFVSATALYVASVLPSWILTLVFLWRLQRSLGALFFARNPQLHSKLRDILQEEQMCGASPQPRSQVKELPEDDAAVQPAREA